MTSINLVFVSTNSHKLKEIREMIPNESMINVSKPDHIPEIEETGLTFEENAKIKALALLDDFDTDTWVMAEDSGIEVAALDGRPGIYSARYGGPGASARQQCDQLLEEMQGISDRQAQYYFAIALYHQSLGVQLFSGIVTGQLSDSYRGENGFGYDPIFIPDGHSDTFGILDPSIKTGLSHRGRALEKMMAFLQAHFSS